MTESIIFEIPIFILIKKLEVYLWKKLRKEVIIKNLNYMKILRLNPKF